MIEKRKHVRILKQETGVRIRNAAQAFCLHRSSWYYKSKPRAAKRSSRPLDPVLKDKLLELTGYELTLGYRKVSMYLRYEYSIRFNHKKVYRHMEELKILQPRFIRRRRTKKLPTALWYCPLKSDVRWEADLTVIPYEHGQLFLFSVIDVFDKELIGEWFGFRCQCIDAIAALKQAVYTRFPDGIVPENLDLVLRLDRGCQFTAFEFAQAARGFRIRIEYCDVQAPNQKPFIESFFASFKREEVFRNIYQNPIHAFSAWKNYVRWYNQKRPHGAIGFISPTQFRIQQKGKLFSKKHQTQQHSLV